MSGEWGMGSVYMVSGEWGVQVGNSRDPVCVCESVESVRVSGVGWGLTGEVESGE